MSWDKDSLWNKARLFFEKGFEEDKEKPFFGLWCAMGLELLSRAAIAKISPTLLAEPDREQQNILHALGLGSAKAQKKSIGTFQVLTLCKSLITEFKDEEFTIASAIVGRRNEDLHSGTAAFSEYPTQLWIGGFYKCCKVLAESMNENLTSLLGEEISKEANVILADIDAQLLTKTKALIAAHTKVFENKEKTEKERLSLQAKENSESLAYRGHHRVKCPACQSTGTVYGEPHGKENIEHGDGEIIVRESILPTKFSCIACDLKLNGYGALSAAGIADHYTRRTNYSPEEYYDMINPDDHDSIASHYERHNEYGGWSNE